MVVARHLALEAAILADRSDVQSYLVYADWLASRGDPRGELIVAMYRGVSDGNALLLRDRILQRNPDLTPRLDRWNSQLRWHLGFLDHVTLDRVTAEDLDTLFAHPSATLLRALTLRLEYDETYAIFTHLAKTSCDQLEVLNIERDGPRAQTIPDLDDLDGALFAHLPNLRAFTFKGRGPFRSLAHPRLQELSFEGGVFETERWQLPRLTTLRCAWCREIWESDLPSLRHLDLRWHPTDLLAQAGFARIVRQLETLHIHVGSLGEDADAACERFEASADLVKHLQRLEITYSLIEREPGHEQRIRERLTRMPNVVLRRGEVGIIVGGGTWVAPVET